MRLIPLFINPLSILPSVKSALFQYPLNEVGFFYDEDTKTRFLFDKEAKSKAQDGWLDGRKDGVRHICYCVMKPSKAACFGLLSKTLVTKQDKHRTDQIASVFMQNSFHIPSFPKAKLTMAQLAH